MIKVLIPSGALGLGYDKGALERGIGESPDIIAIDGGSTDSGPAYLGRGVSKYSRASTKLEWRGLMEARAKAGVPLIIGTAGTCGTDATVNWLLDITREVAAELGQNLKVATLRSSQPKERVKTALNAGRIGPLFPAPEISNKVIDSTTNIVALAGAEQIGAALQTGADIVIAGRTTDTATIAALPLLKGCHAGGAWHGAKIGECGAFCTSNPSSGVIMIEFDEAGFTVTPMADDTEVTPHTVSAHMLYENSDPFILYEPGGHLDVTNAKYQESRRNSVRVEGARWIPSDTYTVKLEGSRHVGYQTVLLALLRDDHYVRNARRWADDIIEKASVKAMERLSLKCTDFSIDIRLIGQDATFGEREIIQAQTTELGALAIVNSNSEATASEVAKIINPYLLHHALMDNEETPTFAFQFSPAEINVGATYAFCLNHVMVLDDPMEAFTLEVHEVGNG